MFRFIKNIFLFALPLALLLYASDLFISYQLKKTQQFQGEFQVWNDIYDGRVKSEIAIYGSSRAWVHIDPAIIEDSLGMPAYNFGMDGHNFWLQYLRHLEYLSYNTNPKVIIHSVDVFSLEKIKELYNLNQFLPYMLWNQSIYHYTSSYVGYAAYDYLVPLVRYFKQSREIIEALTNPASSSSRDRIKGFKGMEKVWNGDLLAAMRERKSYRSRPDSTSILLFRKYLEQCQANKIEVILVYTPEYIEGQQFVSNRATVIHLYEKFAKDFNVLFLNYSNHEICHDKKYFYNATHLNSAGADLFTKILAHDIKEARAVNPNKSQE